MKLKVYYSVPEEINCELDQAIEKAVLPFGLTRWASGVNLLTGERDLDFDDKKKEESNETRIT